ncbi:glycosyltransferase family 4 protein [Salinibacterium sp. SWN1162]|uniref:glycosyltransferase family 4 protein n=1 Tax=Salinibacterium sp. SWN1162 TaxID=2792053 RepID=UPI0018CDE011|nr:glycosyltransferase [Salinibacterium sp. SWN1162]MBH0008129.1 glycosyltransferase [Salinibacterium sp. SWN1162]
MQVEIARAFLSSESADIAVSFDVSSESAQNLGLLPVPRLVVGGHRFSSGRGRLFRRLIAQPATAWRLIRFCRTHSIDVIYEVMDHPLQLVPRILARLFGIRVLTSVHDATRHSGDKSRFLDLVSRISLKATDGVMTYSVASAQELKAAGLAARVPVFDTVLGARGSSNQALNAREPKNATFTVGFFGRIEAYKGIARLAGAIVLLRERGFPVRLSLYGRGRLTALERTLLGQARAGVNSGWVADEDIPGVIDSFDILALPYDDASQSGVIGLALTSGIPIVATPVGGLREQVLDSGGGVLARGMSVEDFADAIEGLISDPALYQSLSERGIEAAHSSYSWDRVSSDILSATRLLAKAPRQ